MIRLEIKVLAAKLGVHRNTIRNWVKSGKLAARPAPGRGLLLSEAELLRLCATYQLDPESLQPRRLAGDTAPAAAGLPAGLQLSGLRSRREAVMSEKLVGAVLVVGGGIAGIQAALDLADSGYKVYLVEKGPGIGGKMAQLDKTFPTNDCAM